MFDDCAHDHLKAECWIYQFVEMLENVSHCQQVQCHAGLFTELNNKITSEKSTETE